MSDSMLPDPATSHDKSGSAFDGPAITAPAQCATISSPVTVSGTFAGPGPVSVTVVAVAISPCDNSRTAMTAVAGQEYDPAAAGKGELGSGSATVVNGNWSVTFPLTVSAQVFGLITASAEGSGSSSRDVIVSP